MMKTEQEAVMKTEQEAALEVMMNTECHLEEAHTLWYCPIQFPYTVKSAYSGTCLHTPEKCSTKAGLPLLWRTNFY